MSKDSTKSFKDAFGQFLKEEHLDSKFRQKQLTESWERIMGKSIALRTTKMYFHEDIMMVELSSASLKEELNRSKEIIMGRIKEHMGSQVVRDVRFI